MARVFKFRKKVLLVPLRFLLMIFPFPIGTKYKAGEAEFGTNVGR